MVATLLVRPFAVDVGPERREASMHRNLVAVSGVALVLGLVPVGIAQADDPPNTPVGQAFEVEVVSSAPGQVTGGDARLHVTVPRTVPLHQVEVWVGGEDRRTDFSVMPGTRTLTGVVDGLELGDNALEIKANGRGGGRPDPVTLTLTNYPITGPVFSGPHQYPFVCNTVAAGLGQPIADDPATGTKVFDASGNVVGYSRDCSVETQVAFRYRTTSGAWKEYTPGMGRPEDMATTTTTDGKEVDFVVRWERGTVNRFIYSIAMLAPDDADTWDLGRSAWNGKVIYRFDGGVAIGHTQGATSTSSMLYDVGLARGYAIIFSTGTRTSTHYNLQLGGETALMVKERFIERYDVPKYTVGIGGSGGAIQQYVYAQNHPGLLDAAIPQYSYPDMVTQAIHVGDCELLEFWMDVLDGTNPKWATWTNRSLLEGLNASNTLPNQYTGGKPGLTECINGWRGLAPLALNPRYGSAPNQQNFVPQSAIAATEWSHFGDIVNIVGRDTDDYARNYWDNVGVQYGLESVAAGKITPGEFLKLNAMVGGWKNEPDMVQEGSPFYPPGVIDPANWDPWSQRNQVYSTNPSAAPAPRTEGNLQAMNAAYTSGLVFRGDIDIPVIDWRNYLEDELDMHNSQQSFATRQRMLNADGDASNQVIWFTDVVDPSTRFDQTPEALSVMDEWMANIGAHPEKGVVGNKPATAVDRCFDDSGVQIAAGTDVWDGILDTKPDGACTTRFPIYSTSRRIAGGPIEQSYFKCALQPVNEAIAEGLYGTWTPSTAETQQLNAIFPQGVCDYMKPDVGLPPGW
jgi:hypothetical protein